MKSKIKKRKFSFDKKVQDIKIINEDIQAYEIIPGLTCELPEFSYDIVKNVTLLIAINTTLAHCKDRNITLKQIDLTNKNNNFIIIKSNYQDYLYFVQSFITLVNENIEHIHLED